MKQKNYDYSQPSQNMERDRKKKIDQTNITP